MIGISVYLSQENETFNKKWIEKAAAHGFSSIFTSLHIPEGDTGKYKDLLVQLGEEAKMRKMELFADISPKSFEYLGMDIDHIDQLQNIGVKGLRVDYGLSIEEIVALSKKMKISLSASTLNEDFLRKLVDQGLNTKNTEATHNFYPRPETGLARDYFTQKNQLLKKYKLGVTAFIPGDGKKRQPLYEGLPTLEEHRNLPVVQAYLDLADHAQVDAIYIGDPSLSDETLEKFSYLAKEVIPLRYEGENSSEFVDFHKYLQKVQVNRRDPARDVVRFGQSRIDLHDHKNLNPLNTVKRKKGAITIDNVNYGRYAGEIHITQTDLKENQKVNVIGEVIEEDIPLLDFVGAGSQVLLKKVN